MSYVPATLSTQPEIVPAFHSAAPSSIIDAMRSYQDYYQFAQALAASRSIPEAFQKNTGDCLIALDLAARLGISPLTVFQHLYIVSGKPAFSAQFCVALVNGSGKFSRITFAEGQDGHATVKTKERDGWDAQNKRYKYKTATHSVENLYCEACFTELATGQKFSSGRIDLRFADKNGWFDKADSKWAVMPKQMLRYRAAALLIRTYAPELVLGLHTVEEAEDVSGETVVAPPTFETPVALAAEPEIAAEVATDGGFLARILAAPSLDELGAIGAEISGAELTPEIRAKLRAAYGNRATELKQAVAPPVEPEPEPAPAPAAKPKRGSKKTPTIADEIASATTFDALDKIAERVRADHANGALDDAALDSALAALDAKTQTLEAEAAETVDEEPQPTAQQIRYAAGLLNAINEAPDVEIVDKNAKHATEWSERGYITKRQAKEILDAADKKRSTFLF
ncbi:MAG: recombinase RecT [Thermoguttaceae bacterium]|nr:recombinase RecT [Thermoguttaceae bacterium]